MHNNGTCLHVAVQAKLDQLNGQLLAIFTSSAAKWAFLSVVKHHRAANDGGSMSRLDSLVISRIFELAGSPIRRNFLALLY